MKMRVKIWWKDKNISVVDNIVEVVYGNTNLLLYSSRIDLEACREFKRSDIDSISVILVED